MNPVKKHLFELKGPNGCSIKVFLLIVNSMNLLLIKNKNIFIFVTRIGTFYQIPLLLFIYNNPKQNYTVNSFKKNTLLISQWPVLPALSILSQRQNKTYI